MSNEKKNFAIQTSLEECTRAMSILEKMDGNTNAQKLTTMLDMVTSALERDGLSVSCKSHVQSIDDSLANIKANIISIVKSGAEERKHNAAELQDRIESQAKTVQSLQQENEALKAQLATAKESAVMAEANAAAASEKSTQLEKDKAFYEGAARDKDDLNIFLRKQVGALQDEAIAASDKLDALKSQNDSLLAEIARLKKENAEMTRTQSIHNANLDNIISELNDPPV